MDLGGKDEKLDPALVELLDFASPNEHELAKLFSQGVNSIEDLFERFMGLKLILKLGEQGS